jgi:hypothetical protein
MLVTCYSCGATNEFPGPLGRRDKCKDCAAELRCCLQCKLYNADATPECREPQAEVQRDKDRGNFCDFFVAGPGRSRLASDAETAKAAFEALFKKKR